MRCALPGVGPHLAALSAVMIRSVRGGRREARREKGERRVHGRGRGEAGRSKREISAGTRVREGRCAPASTLARQRRRSLPEGWAQPWSEQLWSERSEGQAYGCTPRSGVPSLTS